MRPERVRVRDELGRWASLPSGPGAFEDSGNGPDCLVLGLGPDPGELASVLADAGRVWWVECPDFESQTPPGWADAAPAHWERLAPDRTAEYYRRAGRVLVYSRNMRLFPSFWGSVMADCRLSLAPGPAAAVDEVWLPGSERDLLHLDLLHAFEAAGLHVRVLPDETTPSELAEMLRQGRPKLFFSVNLQGFDPLGESIQLLRRAEVRTAVWCVDNPYHLISSMRSHCWREVEFFVTDHWFLEPLKRDGVRRVAHLPLAASGSMFGASPHAGQEYYADRLVFAGRSRFPGKRRFFAGCKLDPTAWTEARTLLVDGLRPDFAWWRERLGVARLWPGAQVRQVGFSAEEANLAWRSTCLEHASHVPLTVFGDEGWRDVLANQADLRGAVDYHTELPSIYAAAGAVLNVTSLLLPWGLTNRHFDAPAAGGLILTDDTPGLSIFPEDLVREVRFHRAERIPALFDRVMAEPLLRTDLIRAWGEEIRARHTYAARAAAVLNGA